MEFKLNKDQRNVANGASNEGSRPVLEAVHFRNGIAEVADGFILVQKYIDYTGPEMLINAKQLLTIKDAKCISGAYFVNDESNGHIEVNMLDSKLTLQKTIGTFPNADQLYPADEPVFRIAIGKSILQKICKTMNKDSEMIKFYFTTPSNPIGFKVENDCQGLIMPMFAGEEFQHSKLEPFKVEKPEPEQFEDITDNIETDPEPIENNMQQYVDECMEAIENLIDTPQLAAPVAV